MITSDSPDVPIELIKSGMLDLTIHKAENLEKCDLFGKGDPYVVVLLNGQKIHKTAVKHGTQQPSFNESKQCLLADVTKSYLLLSVYDEDKFGSDKFLGSVEFNLVRLRSSHLEYKAVPLQRQEKDAHGCLFVSLSFIPMPIIRPKIYGVTK